MRSAHEQSVKVKKRMEEVQEGGGFTQGCLISYAVGIALIIVLITMVILFTSLFGSGLIA